MSAKVQMLAVVSRSKRKGKLEVIAFCDGVQPAGVRPITAVVLNDTRCLVHKVRTNEDFALASWFNRYDHSLPVTQQALVVLLETDSLSLKEGFEVTPLGHAVLTHLDGMPIHLPNASISTRKKLYAMHWDQMRGLLRQYQDHQKAQLDQVEADTAALAELVTSVEESPNEAAS